MTPRHARRPAAIAAAVLPLALAIVLLAAAPAFAAGPAWSVTTSTNSPSSPSTSFTEGDGVQNLSSYSNTDTYTVTATNSGDTVTAGTATVSLNFQGTGVSLRSVLPNVPTATGTVTSGSNCITAVAVTTGPFVVGQPISGTGIPSGSTLVAVNGVTCGASTLQVSQAATSTGTGRTITQPATASTPTGTGWTCTNASTPTCTRSDALAPGASYPPITFTVQVSPTAGVGTATGSAPMHVTASTTASGGGAASGTTISAVTPVIGVPDLTATNTPSGPFRQGDPNDVYKIVVVNQGGGATNSGAGTPPPSPIVATVTVPAGETAVSLSGGGWTCNLGAITTPYNLPADSCYRTDSWGYAAELPAITLVVSVASNATTPQSQSVTVSGGGELVAPISVAASTAIQQSADLNATLAHTGSFDQGDVADTYSLTVRNVVGPNSIAGGPTLGQVLVTDTAPPGETITGMSGAGWTCSLTPVVIPVGNPNLVLPADSCARTDALAVNNSYPAITVTVSVANGAPSPQVNSATVSGGGMTAASTAGGGQTSTDSTVINPQPDLRVITGNTTSSPSDTFTQGDGSGQGDTLLVTIHNEGFAATNGTVTVTDVVPSGLTPQSAVGSGWSCGLAGQIVTCMRGDALGAGSSYGLIAIAVTVAANAPSSVTNDVSVAGGGEINPNNDVLHQPIGITQLPDLAVAMADSGPFERNDVGDKYSIAVFNDALVQTSGTVTAVVTLGSGVTATAIAGTGWTCNLGTLTCSRSDAVGSEGVYPTITVTVNVAGNAPSSISSSVTVSGGGEVYTANDTANDTTAVPLVLPGAQPAASAAGSNASGSGLGLSVTANPLRPIALTIRIARSGPRGYLVTGRLLRPAQVSPHGACTGLVTIQIANGKHRTTTRTAHLTSSCTYAVAGVLPAHQAKRSLRITAHFHGNHVLAPTTARHTT
jgi:hypothetical protein